MTKIPKRLEEMIEENADQYRHKTGELELTITGTYKAGATDLTLAVLSEAEKLAIALDAMIKAARDNNCGLRIADETLSDWKKFLGDE